MNLSRHAITAGIAALSLAAATASPALAKGGAGGGGDGAGDINNTVIQIAPGVVPATTNGGGGKPTKCTSVLVDPVNMVFVGTCTTNRV
jgi:hypothetical protein